MGLPLPSKVFSGKALAGDACPRHAFVLMSTGLWLLNAAVSVENHGQALSPVQHLSDMPGFDCRCCSRTKTRSMRHLRTAHLGLARAGAMPHMLLQLAAPAGPALEVSTLQRSQHHYQPGFMNGIVTALDLTLAPVCTALAVSSGTPALHCGLTVALCLAYFVSCFQCSVFSFWWLL